MEFEWNLDKSRTNLDKHGLAFEDAEIVFRGIVVTVVDNRQNYGELRFISMGLLHGRVVLIVHVKRLSKIRIISMRKANAREQQIYKKRLKEIGLDF